MHTPLSPLHLAPFSLAWLQTSLGLTDSQAHWLIALTCLNAIAVLMGMGALLILAIVVVKLIGTVTALLDELKPKIYPIMDNVKQISGKANDITGHVRDVVADSTPKVKRVTTNIAETSDVYRAKLAEIDSLISDTAAKAKRQTDRVDNIVSSTLSSAGKVASKVEDAVLTPVHQASALWSAVKAATETLVRNYSPGKSSPKPSASRPFTPDSQRASYTPPPIAFTGENIYTGLEDDYHA